MPTRPITPVLRLLGGITAPWFHQKPGVSELAVKTAPRWRLPPPRSRPTPTPVRQNPACVGRLRGPLATQARLSPPARLPPDPRFWVEPGEWRAFDDPC